MICVVCLTCAGDANDILSTTATDNLYHIFEHWEACCSMHCMHSLSSVVVLALNNQVLHSPSQAGGILWPPFLDTGGDLILNKLTGLLLERICIAFDILSDFP